MNAVEQMQEQLNPGEFAGDSLKNLSDQEAEKVDFDDSVKLRKIEKTPKEKREFILQELSTTKFDVVLKTKFPEVLKNTSDTDVATMYKALNEYPNMKNKMFDNRLNLLTDDSVKSFHPVELKTGDIDEYTIEEYKNIDLRKYYQGVVLQFPASLEENGKGKEIEEFFSKTINRVTVEYVDSPIDNKFNIIPHAKFGDVNRNSGGTFADRMILGTKPLSLSEDHLSNIDNFLLTQKESSKKIAGISIMIPEGYPELKSQITTKVENYKKDGYPYPIDIQEQKGLSTVEFKWIEKTEEIKDFNFEINNLPYNVLANPEQVRTLLNDNEEMKNILNDPSYKITNLIATGSASYQDTDQDAREHLKDYKEIFPTTNKTSYGKIVNQEDGGIFTKNPSLAYDRAASLVDVFYTDKKITSTTPVQIEYGVNGQTKQELKDLGKTDAQIEEHFFKNQYAKLKIEYIKETLKPREGISITPVKPQYVGLRVMASNEKQKK